MNVIDHDDTDGKKVWLSIDETDQLLNEPDSMERSIAFELAVRCGLRSAEVLEVTPDDVVETDAGDMLKVPDGKGDKYRETPLPSTLKRQIQTVAEMRDEGSDEPIISVTTTQSLRNWINSSREALAEETDDDRWNHLSMHDLRRTWATQVAENDVDPLVVCQWGGWNDLDTFLEHYRGTYSPDAQRRERNKVNWL
jgi:integrase